MDIPIELIEQIKRGNCVLFLGWAGLAANKAQKLKTLDESVLAQRLAGRVHYFGSVSGLNEVAEYFEIERGRQALIQYVSDVVDEYTLPEYYRTLVKLPFNIIVSTALDNSLQRTLREEGRKYVLVVRDEEISFIDDDRLLVVKLYGDVENKSSIVITKEDYVAFFDQLPNLSDLLKYYFRTKTLLFLDYSLDDPHFLELYAYANQRTKGYQRRAFVVKLKPTQYEIRLWEKRNLTILNISLNNFLANLTSSLIIDDHPLPPKDFITRVIPEEDTYQIHKSPYKFLSNYEEQDINIFFGRDQDTIHTIQKLLSSKLMVLYGKSGYGKTSLIHAGITPRLTRGGYLAVYARCAGDPILSIKTNVIDRLLQVDNKKTSDAIAKLQTAISLSMLDFIREFKKVERRSLVVLIDQFEEFFISLGDATRRQFEKELAQCVGSPYIDVTFLLSLREDFLPELNELKELHNIFESSYRLKALTNRQAIEAIVKPAEMFGITFDDGLIEIIAQELSEKDQIDPAQLQIVCDRLYNTLSDKETRIRTALYEQLGGVKQILTDYVDSILDSFGPKRRSTAQRLLRSMVTSWYTRISLRYSDAILETSNIPDWNEQNTKELLNDLIRVRLIRRVADLEEEAYELTHEYLINKIRDWIDLEMLKVKEAQDLLRQEYNNWQRHRIPMDKFALKIVNAQRERLVLNNNLKAFILAAAVRYDFEFEYWVNRNLENHRTIDMVLWLLREDTPDARRLAGIALALLTNEQDIVSQIYDVYETIANPNVIAKIEELSSLGFVFVENFRRRVQEIVRYRFTKNMVTVKEGEFLMGTPKEAVDAIIAANDIPPAFFEGEYPQRIVVVEEFYIDKFLVTNEDFHEFKSSHTFPAGHENHPATGVSWYEAREYAHWIGKDLPFEEEWEKAARGTEGWIFPWGNEWDPARCNTRLSGYGGTTSVNMFPSGASPYGCFDMSGNVWEWTSTWLNGSKKQMVLKGGSWSKYGILPWCAYRFNYEADSGYSNVGFRCVKRGRTLS